MTKRKAAVRPVFELEPIHKKILWAAALNTLRVTIVGYWDAVYLGDEDVTNHCIWMRGIGLLTPADNPATSHSHEVGITPFGRTYL